ncbi:Hydantoin racemase [Halomonadaceae bacterium LMG 33818]|uniref:aspartate/glutamate racemase family protein n=1 Tax=Cernens ardua TaxID=3402176 RepID=UPI003EDB8D82
MRIHVINPNTSQAMSEKIAEAACKAAQSAEIVMHTNRDGAPSLESHFEEAIAVPGILRIVDEITREARADGILIACFGDPGIHAAREIATVPVMGIAEAAMRTATTIGRRFSVMTSLARTLPMAEAILRDTGLNQCCARLRASELDVAALEDIAPEAYQQLLNACKQAIKEDEIDALVLGCAGMADLTSKLSKTLGIPVIDGVAAGIQQLEGLAHLGLKPAKTGDRATPPKKELYGPYQDLARK